MEKTNEILTIAGKRVRVAYTGAANHCDRCCIKPRCRKYIRERCRDYNDPNSPLHAIFVPAEEIEGTSKEVTLIPSNEDEDKAAEEACEKCPISGRCFVEDKGRKDACDYLRGVKAGIAYERERMASCPTIKGWIARDEDGALSFFGSKPYRNFGNWVAKVCIKLNRKLFPSLKMKNGPMKVKLIILK